MSDAILLLDRAQADTAYNCSTGPHPADILDDILDDDIIHLVDKYGNSLDERAEAISSRLVIPHEKLAGPRRGVKPDVDEWMVGLVNARPKVDTSTKEGRARAFVEGVDIDMSEGKGKARMRAWEVELMQGEERKRKEFWFETALVDEQRERLKTRLLYVKWWAWNRKYWKDTNGESSGIKVLEEGRKLALKRYATCFRSRFPVDSEEHRDADEKSKDSLKRSLSASRRVDFRLETMIWETPIPERVLPNDPLDYQNLPEKASTDQEELVSPEVLTRQEELDRLNIAHSMVKVEYMDDRETPVPDTPLLSPIPSLKSQGLRSQDPRTPTEARVLKELRSKPDGSKSSSDDDTHDSDDSISPIKLKSRHRITGSPTKSSGEILWTNAPTPAPTQKLRRTIDLEPINTDLSSNSTKKAKEGGKNEEQQGLEPSSALEPPSPTVSERRTGVKYTITVPVKKRSKSKKENWKNPVKSPYPGPGESSDGDNSGSDVVPWHKPKRPHEKDRPTDPNYFKDAMKRENESESEPERPQGQKYSSLLDTPPSFDPTLIGKDDTFNQGLPEVKAATTKNKHIPGFAHPPLGTQAPKKLPKKHIKIEEPETLPKSWRNSEASLSELIKDPLGTLTRTLSSSKSLQGLGRPVSRGSIQSSRSYKERQIEKNRNARFQAQNKLEDEIKGLDLPPKVKEGILSSTPPLSDRLETLPEAPKAEDGAETTETTDEANAEPVQDNSSTELLIQPKPWYPLNRSLENLTAIADASDLDPSADTTDDSSNNLSRRESEQEADPQPSPDRETSPVLQDSPVLAVPPAPHPGHAALADVRSDAPAAAPPNPIPLNQEDAPTPSLDSVPSLTPGGSDTPSPPELRTPGDDSPLPVKFDPDPAAKPPTPPGQNFLPSLNRPARPSPLRRHSVPPDPRPVPPFVGPNRGSIQDEEDIAPPIPPVDPSFGSLPRARLRPSPPDSGDIFPRRRSAAFNQPGLPTPPPQVDPILRPPCPAPGPQPDLPPVSPPAPTPPGRPPAPPIRDVPTPRPAPPGRPLDSPPKLQPNLPPQDDLQPSPDPPSKRKNMKGMWKKAKAKTKEFFKKK